MNAPTPMSPDRSSSAASPQRASTPQARAAAQDRSGVMEAGADVRVLRLGRRCVDCGGHAIPNVSRDGKARCAPDWVAYAHAEGLTGYQPDQSRKTDDPSAVSPGSSGRTRVAG